MELWNNFKQFGDLNFFLSSDWDWGLVNGEWNWGLGNGEWGMEWENGEWEYGKMGNREYPYSQSQEMTVKCTGP